MAIKMSVVEKKIGNHVVYISDSSKELRELKERALPVIALLTEENKAADLSFVHYAVENAEDVDEAFAEKVYCRAYHQPVIVARDEKLYLREFLLTDADDIREIYDGDREGFLERFFDNDAELEDYLKAYIENHYDFYGYGMWAICLNKTGKMVGMGGFSSRGDIVIDGKEETMELGFAIIRNYQGRGLATRAVKLMLTYAERQMFKNSIFATTKNLKAENVLEKAGFQKEGNIWVSRCNFIKNVIE